MSAPEKIYKTKTDYYWREHKMEKTDIEYIRKDLVNKAKSEWFRKGQDSIRRKNDSGCCCKFDENTDEIISVCGAHQEMLEKAVKNALTASEIKAYQEKPSEVEISLSQAGIFVIRGFKEEKELTIEQFIAEIKQG